MKASLAPVAIALLLAGGDPYLIPVSATAPLAADGEYYLRVRAHTRPHHAWFFWPWGGTAFGQATFTFIQ